MERLASRTIVRTLLLFSVYVLTYCFCYVNRAGWIPFLCHSASRSWFTDPPGFRSRPPPGPCFVPCILASGAIGAFFLVLVPNRLCSALFGSVRLCARAAWGLGLGVSCLFSLIFSPLWRSCAGHSAIAPAGPAPKKQWSPCSGNCLFPNAFDQIGIESNRKRVPLLASALCFLCG